MTEIYLTVEKNKIELKSTGHSTHDVCVAISALINAVIRLGDTYREAHAVKCTKCKYAYGTVDYRLEFSSERQCGKFGEGLGGIISGFRLYELLYPEQVSVEVKFEGLHKKP